MFSLCVVLTLAPYIVQLLALTVFFDLLDSVGKVETAGYPPYNIERIQENDYRITLAVAGFSQDDIEIELREHTLSIAGARKDGDEGKSFLYQGIAGRSFERRFQLAEHVEVAGASLENGLLNIDLRREIPEAMKPRKIEIGANKPSRLKVLNKDASAA